MIPLPPASDLPCDWSEMSRRGKKCFCSDTFLNPLLLFVQCFLQISSLLIYVYVSCPKLTVYHAWHSIYFPRKTVILLLLPASFFLLWCLPNLLMEKSPTASTFLEAALLDQQGLSQKSLLQTLLVVWELLQGCSPRQGDTSIAKHSTAKVIFSREVIWHSSHTI